MRMLWQNISTIIKTILLQAHDYVTLHYITLHYITLHYITLHYITLHYITLHYITSLYIIPNIADISSLIINIA
jgi:hypothetical protein